MKCKAEGMQAMIAVLERWKMKNERRKPKRRASNGLRGSKDFETVTMALRWIWEWTS
jgi:hypothetical protein